MSLSSKELPLQVRLPIPPRGIPEHTTAEYVWHRTFWGIGLILSRVPGTVLHIHGGHLHAVASKARGPYILHLHGSDVRTFDPDMRGVANNESGVAEAIRGAEVVLFSTPDLGPFIKSIRPDAMWLPNPASSAHLMKLSKGTHPPKRDFADVFFPHPWTDVKGANSVLELAEAIKCSGLQRVRLVGVASGDLQAQAKHHGFELLPLVSEKLHIKRMMHSKVVLGQGTGLLGVTDLQAVFSGSNLILFPLEHYTRRAYGYDLHDQPTPSKKDLLEGTLSALIGAGGEFESRLDRIRSSHLDSNVLRLLGKVYENI